MTYDLEKYRDKREKVLGVRKRGLSFGTLAAIVSTVIVLGFGVVVVPKSVAYLNNRNLDDAIYKLQTADSWPREVIDKLKGVPGIKDVTADSHGSRIVVTFDRTALDPKDVTDFFKQQDLATVMLNRVNHSQRLHTLKKEAKSEAL